MLFLHIRAIGAIMADVIRFLGTFAVGKDRADLRSKVLFCTFNGA